MATFRFIIFADGFETRQAKTFRAAMDKCDALCRKYPGHVVTVTDRLGHGGESRVCHPDGVITPA